MKSLSTRQAVILLVMAMLSTKIQRLPALLAQGFGRNGWLFILFSIIIDVAMLLVVLRISVLTKGKTVHQALAEKIGKPVAIIYSLVISIFFFIKILTPFRGTHEFFVSAIFDDLNWVWFSIIFILLIMFMGSCGLNRLGRAGEMLWFFVALGFIGAMVLAVPTARFNRILPIEVFDFKEFSTSFKNLSPWVADFIVVLFFVGRVKENKFKTAMLSTFTITSLFTCFFCMTFYSIYDNLSTFPNVAISSITEFSLLSSSLGRIDWILVLFATGASILSSGLFALISCESFNEATTISKKWIAFAIGVLIYILDVFVFTNIDMVVKFFFNYYSWFVLFINYVLPILLWIAFAITKNKKAATYSAFPVRPKSLTELHIKQWNSLQPKQKDAFNSDKPQIYSKEAPKQ